MPRRVVYLIEDDPWGRRDLSGLLAGLGYESWPFQTGPQFLHMLPALEPSCILLGGGPADFAGLVVLAELAERGVPWPVVVAASHGDLRTAMDAIRMGAVDFLAKPVDADELAEALGRAFALLGERLRAARAGGEAQARLASLTPREMEVSLALMAGLSNKAAAHELGISVRTVEMHRGRILQKLGVRTLAEAAFIFAEAGLSPERRRPHRDR
jgi:two-component system, LuxR family, response regulator FixJ